jgi:cbb3-type cytochrome oxidase cytochrome c subunit
MKPLAVRAALVIAAVYGFFLIFAQFSFVELLRSNGASLIQEKIALGSMALAGIGGGFLVAWRGPHPRQIRLALAIAAGVAMLAPFAKSMPGTLGIAILTGAVLGVATVSLAALLPAWCSLPWIGLGTGMGYASCNLPLVFLASPANQAWIAAGFAIVGCAAVPGEMQMPVMSVKRPFAWWSAIAIFTALVWLDSAAFFIIQHAAEMKEGTWGVGHLWRNALLHFSFAVFAGFWLLRSNAKLLPITGWGILAAAALAVNQPSLRPLAGWLYPIGVSLYSTALVAWPSWFSGATDTRQATWRAAVLFAIAGWFGSANGIGMAQTLQRVPFEFIVISGLVLLAAWLVSKPAHWRIAASVMMILSVSYAFSGEKKSTPGEAIARGRQVYLSEGCIHCHSQYVRPGSLDELNWGPLHPLQEVLDGKPVLIGNRRQGPDLTNVGARRSERWLRLHFINPQAFVKESPMPSYAHLFESEKGNDLLRYLKDSSAPKIADVMKTASNWIPQVSAEKVNGEPLFAAHCASCHGTSGAGNGPLAEHLSRKPANLVAGPFAWSRVNDELDLTLSRLIKFGILGTDMAGHETLTDAQILALKDKVLDLRK